MEKYLHQWRLSKQKENLPTEGTVTDNSDSVIQNSIEKSANSLNAIENVAIPESKKNKRGTPYSRKYLLLWTKTYEWIRYNESLQRVFCKICTTAYEEIKIPRDDPACMKDSGYKTFVVEGFSNWKKAVARFKDHENSKFHRNGVLAVVARERDVNVSSALSLQLQQSRNDARHCLLKIFESIRFLACQGIPFRGDDETQSNFIQLLKLRCLDDGKLQSWMERSKYKWISHDIINEILSILARSILDKVISKIKEKSFFAFMADETTDISRKEQMSVNFRVVEDNMDVHEYFLGFYDTPKTDADTLFKIVEDIFTRFQLKFDKCRGQCYDGAPNVSGGITGLQTRIRKIEPRAFYVHCAGHNLNLVAQDSMKLISEVADLLSIMRDLITFIRASAKRINIFNDIKSQLDDGEVKETGGSLHSFCMTRWCVRVKSVKSVRDNYKGIMDFCELAGQETGDAAVKARGFLAYLSKFETVLLLELTIVCLEKVEDLNETLQATTVNFKTVIKRVDLLKTSMTTLRSEKKFDEIWIEVEKKAKEYNLEPPTLPRQRVLPRRFDDRPNTAYFPSTLKEKYRKIYFQIIDQIVMSIDERFDSESYKILSKMEDYATNKCDLSEITKFLYKNNECDFDIDRLNLHRSMFFDSLKDKKVAEDLSKISIYLQKNDDIRKFCSEYTKFIKLLVTYPQTVVVAERSFSTLKYLKNFLRSTSTQQRVNDLAILYLYREMAYEIDMQSAMNEFICRNTVRENTFAH